ncbi:MAG TPA: EAL domain-containing protein, partial [Gammaproteobacteria bacterium]|nr:EAL domain-containing protein [Gammaproteobacteria bacterium]
AAIATAIIALGRSLNLRVVAEGVETQAQASFMREQGCHLGQGFLFHRPLPADQVAALIPATPERKARSQTL